MDFAVPNGGGGAHEISHQRYALSGKSTLRTFVILLFTILFMAIFFIFIYWRVRRSPAGRSRRRRRHLVFAGESQPHPLPASNRGLDLSILKSLSLILFRSDTEDYQMECTICLNGFAEEEKIRKLPLCGHPFHPDCIDMWLYSHSNCPLCRSAIQEVKEAVKLAADPTSAAVEGSPLPDPYSSSSNYGSGELLTELPARGAEGTSVGEEREASHSASQILMTWPNCRIDFVRRLLMREIRANCTRSSVAEIDLEGGGRAAPLPLPLPPAAAVAE
ncbi:RING-H2 finger protein ATL2 [Apostasia shenzhenica]|uniref:RING-type E3 ubiquitin transferase n=1 Tax=Apostasia shenzhenica TaxID=1088818 RepID=A0A2I0ASA0_9ASPA|nr:RING-H2 finger protein ATL2 [Apostasia shenzhenica]